MVVNIVLITIGLIISIVNCDNNISIKFEGYVVGGGLANIRTFPHVALLSIECGIREYTYDKIVYTCGSSILNQAIVITAGHCLEICIPKYSFVTAFVGSDERMGGTPYIGSSFKIHEKYDSAKICNDIALVRLQKFLNFGRTVRRVSLARNSLLYLRTARVAGWGYNIEQTSSNFLIHVSQRIWSRSDCIRELGRLVPEGTICGGEVYASSYITQGDSGSALMVRKFVQVGVVSFKIADRSKSLAVYTEVAFFHDWIQETAKTLYCGVDYVIIKGPDGASTATP